MESTKSKSERDQWIKIKKNFQSYAVDEYWEQGFRLFRGRINNKFLAPLDEIIELKNHIGEGFAIVIVQCALIETFASFKYGKVFNPRYNEGNDPTFQYRDSRKIFTDFLHEEKIFENHFYIMKNGSKILDQPFIADDFYSNVRCALVHEGKTRNNWTINVRPRDVSGNIFIKNISGKHKIYRTFLQKSLKEYLHGYINDLQKEQNDELRKFFGRKMDHIHSLRRGNLDWWHDI